MKKIFKYFVMVVMIVAVFLSMAICIYRSGYHDGQNEIIMDVMDKSTSRYVIQRMKINGETKTVRYRIEDGILSMVD